MKFKENDIITPRLALVAITPDSLQSERLADRLLGRITNAHVPIGWPPEHWEPHVFELLLKRVADDPTEVGWHRYIALRHTDKSRTLIGTLGGLRRAERPEECELGYSVLAGCGKRVLMGRKQPRTANGRTKNQQLAAVSKWYFGVSREFFRNLLEDFQGNGYATEGTKALIDWALARSSLKMISAQTFPSLPKSIRVMEKCGMKYVGAGDGEGTVRYQWQRHD